MDYIVLDDSISCKVTFNDGTKKNYNSNLFPTIRVFSNILKKHFYNADIVSRFVLSAAVGYTISTLDNPYDIDTAIKIAD